MGIPLYSIIIPTYNRAEALRKALDSIERQTFRDYEVIVCDDGSTDHTEKAAHDFADRINVRYIRDENWGGPARPRNNGLKTASGKWICFLDSDDWWYPDKLEVVTRHLASADVVYHDLDIYTSDYLKTSKKCHARQLKTPVFADLMINWNAFPNSSAVVRKGILDKVGGLCEDKALIAVEDHDLWLRVAGATDRFVYVRKNLGGYLSGCTSITEVSERQIQRMTALFAKHAPLLSEDDRTRAKGFLDYAVGRVKLKMGKRAEAVALFKSAVFGGNFAVKCKSVLSLAEIGLSGPVSGRR
jgi:cellulose synthase/poly-beta-1,6-N-acetylglucosamine synthase-like glycosyltransferase